MSSRSLVNIIIILTSLVILAVTGKSQEANKEVETLIIQDVQ